MSFSLIRRTFPVFGGNGMEWDENVALRCFTQLVNEMAKAS